MVCEAGPPGQTGTGLKNWTRAPKLLIGPLGKLCDSCATAEELRQFIDRLILTPVAFTSLF